MPGFAQQGTFTSAGGQTTGSLSGTGGLAGGLGGGGLGGGGLGGGGLGGGGGMGGGGLGGSSLTGTALMGLEAAPQITAPGTAGGGSSVINASNFLGPYYGSPTWQGLLVNKDSGPGGFGAAHVRKWRRCRWADRLRRRSRDRRRTAAMGGRGGIGGIGGRGGLGGGAGQSAVVAQLPVQISYPAIARFSAPPVPPPQIQADISGMIARSAGLISNPAGIQVTVDGDTVILRGRVKDLDEAQLIENVVRLTPGVHGLRSELTFPKP